MSRRSIVSSRLAVLGTAAVVGALLVASGPGFPDDRDLLRFSSSKPYLFILLDTSASMNLKIGAGDVPLIGGGDNPSSRLYAAKQALYNVFSNVDDVYFGFASFNQDGTRVRAKHYLYYLPNEGGKPAGWPLSFPAADPDGLTQYVDQLNLSGVDSDGDGRPDATDGTRDTFVEDVEGDVLTFGRFFDLNGNGNEDPSDRVAGSCASPLPLGSLGSRERLKVSTFALLGEAGTTATTVWLSTSGPNRTYRLTVTPVGGALGDDQISVSMTLELITSCSPVTPSATSGPWTWNLTLERDPRLNETIIVDGDQMSGESGGNAPAEVVPNLWPAWSDAVTSAACDSGKPFSGKGWEGNYDSGDVPPPAVMPSMPVGYPGAYPSRYNADKYCINPNNPATCVEIKPVVHTTYSAIGLGLATPRPELGRPLDKGDMIPFDWNTQQRSDLLLRFAPRAASPPDFGIAKHLVPSAVSGLYEPAPSSQAPLIGIGNTPLGKAILDFRCWYMGTEGNNGGKCRDAATSSVGWHQTACQFDPEYGCRKPYLIVISDGGDNCPGENPAADTASMNSHSGIKTWAINVGAPANNKPDQCATNSVLHSIAQNGKGECVMVESPEELLSTIQNILGQIREEARSFASAAVPSVQAVADQAIYLTNFTPLNNDSRWPGHVNAFLKPLPLTNDGRPDTSCRCGQTCAGRTGPAQDGCFLWDAGEVLAGNPNADPPVSAQTRRYVRYGRQSAPGLWAANVRELAGTDADAMAGDPDFEEIRYDLWRAFGLIESTAQTDSETPADEAILEEDANAIIDTILSPRTRTTNCDATKELCTYLLGDIFHSDPLVLGQAGNIEYFRQDLGTQFNGVPEPDCEAAETSNDFDRGYRCFFERHKRRRQILLIGSNDGMVHAFNAAQFRTATGRYDNGSGHELFAYMPRSVMPTVAEIASGPTHHFTVDGALAAGDVFIDPIADAGGFPNPDHRRWRTVAIGGLREGGRGYYALDVTQPDVLTSVETNGILEFFPTGDPEAASCLDSLTYTVSDCGPLTYGAPLWEFTDSTDNAIFTVEAMRPEPPLTLDEDENGLPDLGETWSTADFARIALCRDGGSNCRFTVDPATSSDVEQKFVVIFGGGMDPDRKNYDPRSATATAADPAIDLSGHWLYMVDVETGATIYKRQLCSPYRENEHNLDNPCIPGGPVPSQVAAVDTNLDGFVDRIYVGSIGGYLYRVDLTEVEVDADSKPFVRVPGLADTLVNAIDAIGQTHVREIRRVPAAYDDGTPVWAPKVIFDTNWDGMTATPVPRPIYYRPAVIVNQTDPSGSFALGFGTGDREDLWNANQQPGRFFMFMDDSGLDAPPPTAIACGLTDCPWTENDFANMTFISSTTDNILLTQRGWYLQLAGNERVITDAFSFVGITFFSSFQPTVSITDANGTPITANCGNKQFESNTSGTCAKVGTSNLFLVNATNANPLLIDPATQGRRRSQQVSTFVTNPFTEFSGGGKGQTGDVPGDGEEQEPTRTADDLSETDRAVMDLLKELFPDSCRFVNARVDVKTVAADTTLQKLASIPICLSGHSWKEF